ncbi:MAG TPA: DUF72 domain-containing protein [Longimicrobiales bacterium]|nr:DUF72 domain-containing protein [Longimicrobiales bacterium]
MIRYPGGGRFRIGTSGYDYDHWRGIFYPDDLPRTAWFEHYAGEFATVELNRTFYGLPDGPVFDGWRDRAPRGFLYALKFSRWGTHRKHLKDPRESVGTFVEVARRLEEHLGPVLVQLPPRWRANPDRLRGFLEVAPADLRWSVEVRDASWLNEEVYAVLREAGAALCIHDMIADHPREITADWTYLRYHGRRYAGRYSWQKLTAEAERITDHLENGRDVYAYFNNDAGGNAVLNAAELAHYVRSRCEAAA